MSSEIPGGGPYRAAIGSHDVITAESLRSIRKARSSYCSGDLEVCRRYLGLVREAADLIARARLEEMSGQGYNGVDAGFLRVCERVRDLYAKYISGSAVSRGESVLVEAKSDLLTPEGDLVMAGDVWYVDVRTAAALYALGLVEPVLSWPDALQDVLG